MRSRILTSLFLSASAAWCQPVVVATGLPGAQKITLTPAGNLLVSQPAAVANSGRVVYVTRSGVTRTFLGGLPGGVEVTGAGTSGPNSIAIRERTMYLTLGAGDGERPGPTPGSSIHNPAGASSPLFASILELRFSADIDAITGTFNLTTDHQRTLTDGGEVEIDDGAGSKVRVTILTRFPVSEPMPIRINRFSNLWGLALSEDGRTLFVSDASFDRVSRVDTSTGRWSSLARFPQIPNPNAPVGPPVIDPVPTGIRLYGDQLLVGFLTGFPFVPGYARVLAVNPNGTVEPFIYGVTSVTDILYRPRPSGGTQFFVLEFSANQSASPAPPGRLLRYDAGSPTPTVAAAPLITPVSMAYDDSTKDLFILELRGQVLRLRLD